MATMILPPALTYPRSLLNHVPLFLHISPFSSIFELYDLSQFCEAAFFIRGFRSRLGPGVRFDVIWDESLFESFLAALIVVILATKPEVARRTDGVIEYFVSAI